jgi:hypothetical protein
MLIECDRCVMRDIACADCVVTVLLRTPGPDGELAEAEHRALKVLADARMIPPLRLRPALRKAS